MSGYVADTTSYKPWMQNVMPTFNPNSGFDSIGSYTPSIYGWGSASSSSTSSNSADSLEDFQESQAKSNKEKLAKTNELLAGAEELEAAKKELSEAEALLEKGKQADGTAVIETSMSEYKKMPWWKKALRAASNMGQGVLNLATKFIGIEDGEWKPEKCLKNVAMAAGAIALCCIPYVGPVIGAVLLAGGVISGATGVVRGIKNANEAKSLQELDNAYQDIGAGAFIGVTSALGVRGLGKGFRVNGSTGASVAKTRTSSAGKAWQSVSQFFRDMTINAAKSTKQTVGEQALQFNLAKMNATGRCRNFKAFGSIYKSNVSKMLPALGKERFDKAKQNTANNIQKRIDEIGVNPTDKLQQRELKFLESQLRELNSSATKNQWMNAKKSSKAHQEAKKLKASLDKLKSNGSVAVNGKKLKKANPDDVKALESMIKQAESLAKEMKSLADLRAKTMRWMAMKPKQNKAELEAYAGTSKTSAGYLWDINKGTFTWKTPFKMAWDFTCLPFKPWEYMSKTPAGTFYKLEQGFLPVYEKNMFVDMFGICGLNLGASQTLTKEECANLEAQYSATKKQLAQSEALLDSKMKQLA